TAAGRRKSAFGGRGRHSSRIGRGASHLQSRTWDHAGNADRACGSDDQTGTRSTMMTEVASPNGKNAAGRAVAALLIFALLTALLFLVVPAGFYLWINALHIVAVISWMAGLLYLPRLFVYHADTPEGSAQSKTFKTMEVRLLRFFINPA